MSFKKFLRVAIVAELGIQFVSEYLFRPTLGIGASAEWKNDTATVTASSSPIAIFCSVMGIALFAVLMLTKAPCGDAGVPSWWRRVLSTVIDFYFVVMTLAGVSALLPLGLEALRTGHFVWAFQRHYAVPSDAAISGLVLFDMVLFVLCFVFPLTKGRQTVGCFVMRTKVTPPFGTGGCFTWRGAFRRIWCEFRAFTRWRSLLKPERDADGNTWYDVESGCRVALVDYTTSQ
jgi:hypothetical protein